MKTSMNKKSDSKRVHSNVSNSNTAHQVKPTAAIVQTIVDPPAKPGVPSPPAGFVPKRSGRVQSLTHVQLDVAPGVAKDLRSISKAVFGHNPPDLEALASGIEVSTEWSNERLRTLDYLAYTRDREVASWSPVIKSLEPLGRMFEIAAERDPKLAEDFPSLAQFFAARKEISAKAVRTRKADKKAEQQAASQPISTPSQQQTSTTPAVTEK